ncbi:MAG: cell wall biogenesis protein [Phycisphaeraceae bacterium]|nr:cell wall biogenesis protein [Phycisphaeraceae bacterium]
MPATSAATVEVPYEVPYVDLAGQHAALRGRLLEAVDQVLQSGQFVGGPQVGTFEQRFAALCGVEHAVAVASGTDALALALRALDIGPGDEVITVPNSFIATASAIATARARCVLVDVGDDYNMDPERIETAITSRTRAIVPVHLTGRPADMDPILAVARRHGTAVVEDAAQAVGAAYRGRRVGALGRLGAFSLHPLKTLNACGDAGIVTTDDAALAERVRRLANLGLESRDHSVTWSTHSRLDTIQAAMLLVKLEYLASWTQARRAHAAFYRQSLSDVPQVRVPDERQGETAVYHTLVIEADRRDALRTALDDRGVQTAVHYPRPIHLHAAAADLGYGRGSFPNAERQAGRILSLPVYPELTHDQLDHVAASIRRFYDG